MARNKVVFGSTTLIDLTPTTATAADVASGKVFFDAGGNQTTGTASGGGTSQTVYCGTGSPSSSLGQDGDIYIVVSGSGTAEAYPADFTASGMNSTSNASACIGKSAEDGSSTSNMYSSGQSTTGIVEYTFDIPSIPSTATITSVSCQVKAHEENASRSTFTLQLYAGSTAKGSQTTVNGTSNTIYSLNTGSWTREEIESLVLHTTYGYYGGLVAGATLEISYEMDDPSADVTLTVGTGGWSMSGNLRVKSNGSWQTASTAALEDSIGRG